MTNKKEIALDAVAVYENAGGGTIRRLSAALDYAKKNPGEMADIYYGYYRIIKDALNMPPEEVAAAARVNLALGKHQGLSFFREAIRGREAGIILMSQTATEPKSWIRRMGIEELGMMTLNAERKKNSDSNWKPKDGDSESDAIIWGFTNGATRPITDVHFLVCHGIERVISQEFRDVWPIEYCRKKDWLLNAMTDTIVIRGLQGKGYEAKYLPLWQARRPEGLGWASDHRITAYRQELGI
ncbi:MAG TPA: hypothetical protein VF828_03640 [Patescibacteria group bacterium]